MKAKFIHIKTVLRVWRIPLGLLRNLQFRLFMIG